MQDTPGQLARLTGGLAALQGNIRTVHVHPTADGAVDEVLLHLPANVSRRRLVRAAIDAGGRDVSAQRADVRALDDVPTRALTLAINLLNGNTELARALRAVLGGVDVRWQEEPDADQQVDGFADEVMCLSAPGGGVFVLKRPGSAFTPAEFARARAMTDLALACHARGHHESDRVSIARTELTIRVADREDLAAVLDLHQRCSAATRFWRYSSSGPSGRGLLRLLTPALGHTLAVLDPAGAIIAMGNVTYDGDDGELGLLVRDDWQRNGVGMLLAQRLVDQADALGIGTLVAQTHVENTAIARVLQLAGMRLVGVPEPGEWTWSRKRATEPELALSPQSHD